MEIEFKEFPKMARLSREVVITEKIDGTNASIYIGENGEFLTGSRNRWVTPEADNFGFSKWAHNNKEELMTLGVGHHFGEYWGSGIQRGYGLPKGEKKFSLFNAIRWVPLGENPQRIATADPRIEKYQEVAPACCSVVPVLWRGEFDTVHANSRLDVLASNGSYASPGFMDPEGIVIFHIAGNVGFKKTIKKDNEPKGQSR